ncbi:MAG: aconitate hydratase [Endomicrobiia bacterium]
MNLTQKILQAHLIEKKDISKIPAGEKIGIKIDQTLTQDATGTLVYLEFESLKIDRIKTKLSVSYVDHNTLQTSFENSDDHRYLKSIAQKYGIIFSPAGNGICHQLHLENFAVPGDTLIGSDSHTPTCGAIGMIAIGAGGLDVACALAGEPFYINMPEIINIVLKGKLKPWVSAKDIAFELLRMFSVKGGVGKIFEFTGPALKYLSIPERATITNMGTELGLTTSIFPSDEITRKFFKQYNREKHWKKLEPDKNAKYDDVYEIDLEKIEPMVAAPHSPDNIKKVKEIEGIKIQQVCIGSCTNSSYRDLYLVATILRNHKIHPDVELTISPGSRSVISALELSGAMKWLINSGARILEATCGPCIGMGMAPATNSISLRTFNRNFAGRCGAKTAEVYLCSPETAIASAINGKITDPGKLGKFPKIIEPKEIRNKTNFIYPVKSEKERKKIEIIKGPNIKPLPEFHPIEDNIKTEVVLKLKDNISTDDILPAGAKILPLRSNIPAISEFTFYRVDENFVSRAKETLRKNIIPLIIAGENYGQGSSREHAAIVLRYLGIQIIIAKSFARIHRANLINFGVLPLIFRNSDDYKKIDQNDILKLDSVHNGLLKNSYLEIKNLTKNISFITQHDLSEREKNIIMAGGLLSWIQKKLQKS